MTPSKDVAHFTLVFGLILAVLVLWGLAIPGSDVIALKNEFQLADAISRGLIFLGASLPVYLAALLLAAWGRRAPCGPWQVRAWRLALLPAALVFLPLVGGGLYFLAGLWGAFFLILLAGAVSYARKKGAVDLSRPYRGMAHFAQVGALVIIGSACLYHSSPQSDSKDGLVQIASFISGAFWVVIGAIVYGAAALLAARGLRAAKTPERAAEFGEWAVYANRLAMMPPVLFALSMGLGLSAALLGPLGMILLAGLIGYLWYGRKAG